MSPNCIDVERIAEVGTVPEGHPLRQHVAGCPRCQSLWLSYQSFMQADTSGAKDIDAARTALAGTIRRRAGVVGDPVSRPARMARRSSWAAWMRPALVTAMAAVLTLLAVSIWRGGSDEEVLRGGDASVWVLQPPNFSAGSVVFEWKAVPDADAYEVQVFDDALNEVYQSGATTAPTVTVDRASLSGATSGALTWRVRALRSGDVISVSPPASVALP